MSDIPSRVTPFVLPLSLVLMACILGFSYNHAHSTEYKSMNVTGSAQKIVDADTVKWSVTLSKTVPPSNQADAGRKLNTDREAFLHLLAASGIEANEVSIQPMSLSDVYSTVDYKTGQTALTGYSASQVLVIESSHVSNVETLSQNASVTMAEKGANLSTQNTEYYYGKLADLKLELLTAATRNARERGLAILSGGGGSLGDVTSADTGVFQVTAVNSADLSDYGTYDTSSPKKKVTAVVHATFKLQ